MKYPQKEEKKEKKLSGACSAKVFFMCAKST
jgi:hypothetical protein